MDQPSGETRLEYFDFATASPRQWLVTSERCSWPPSRPLRIAAQFSMPAWTPRLTISCGWKTSGERASLDRLGLLLGGWAAGVFSKSCRHLESARCRSPTVGEPNSADAGQVV